MSQVVSAAKNDFSDRTKYDALMEVIRNRITTRTFDPNCVVPREHYDMILEAARHAPSGANAQPWHFIVITDQNLKNKIMEYFREEQTIRAKLKMKFPTPDYRGLATAPVESASATRFMSRPARSAIATPSARLAICTAPIKLLISLKTVPVPTAPKCLMTSPIGARYGFAETRSAGSAPTSKVSFPAAAACGRPVTGQSI